MSYDIIPRKGVGPIRFGQAREEVRRSLGSPVEEFMKTPAAVKPTDAFDELGIHVFYDQADHCEAIELWDESSVSFDGVLLFTVTPQAAAAWLRQLDPNLEIDDVSATSYRLGFSLYAAEGLGAHAGELDSVLVFRDGYYN